MSVPGMSDVERLVALEEIRRLKARRDRALDQKDWETFEATHWPEHVSDIDDLDAPKTIAETVRDMSSHLANVDTTHHSHSPDITFTSPTEAVGIWMMEDMLHWNQGEEAHWLHGYGYYHETYEQRAGEWRVIHRRLERHHVQTSPGGAVRNATPRNRTGVFWS